MSDWQPIETAPKNGTAVDLWVNGTRVTDAYWGRERKDDPPTWVVDKYETGFGWFADPVAYEPTHWMPIPAPPVLP